jgi:hypothetical protein
MRTRMGRAKRRLVGTGLAAVMIAAAAALVALAGGPALADQNANGSITVTPSVVAAGGTVHISGSVSIEGCPQSDAAIVTGLDALFPPDGFGPQAARDATGAFALDYTVPSSTPAGTYQVGLRCGGGNVGVSAALTVIDAPVGGPATGGGGTAHGSALPGTLAAAVCLVLAAVLVMTRRRMAGRAS